MPQLRDLWNGGFVVILLLAIYIFTHYYFRDISEIEDSNNDGSIDSKELSNYLKKEVTGKSHPIKFRGLVKSSLLGILRGYLMGLLIGGVEAATVTAITLGIVNPILASIEHGI